MAKSDKGASKAPTVVRSRGARQRFLRGMITHDLIERGLDFEPAYEIASAVRDRLAGRDEVTTPEIREEIWAELRERMGPELPPRLTEGRAPRVGPTVRYRGRELPFSRGVLARSIVAAGVEVEDAYQLAAELGETLAQEGAVATPSAEIARRAAALIEARMGLLAARRYRLVRRVHRLPRPLIIYLGGASGTGKSTLALEIAPLLRVYRMTSTDTIRQVMRMVFSPAMLPALQTSSFEIPDGAGGGAESPGSPRDPAFVQRLIESFEEQSARVQVGVRAVVERAIAENMSIIVEGVHLYPPLIPFADLEGAAHQVLLMLGTLDEEVHRSRFLARARLGGRRADRYVENFSSIRVIHEHLMHKVESHDAPLIDTSEPEIPVARTLRLLTGMLERRLPAVGESRGPRAPTLLLAIDGMTDRPVRALGNRTPLQAAETPVLDRLAREGVSGLADPVAPGVVPDTAAGSLAFFGQSPLALKRGPLQALGAGLELSAGDVALRGNFATLDEEGHVLDRRAGRIRDGSDELAAALDRLVLPGEFADEIEIRVQPATEHRLSIVLRGPGLSSAIRGSDPGEGAAMVKPLTPRPDDPSDPNAVFTARLLAYFEQTARRVLADHRINRRRRKKDLPLANTVLSRGAGTIHQLIPLEEAGFPLRLTCIAGDQTILGLAAWLGAETLTHPSMTANLDTDLGRKFRAARKALADNDLVVLHVKGADIAAHDQRPDRKVAFLERFDSALGKMLERWEGPLRIAIASDHSTLSESGQHGADPLPVLIWGDGIEADAVEHFDEAAASGGSMQRFPLQMFLSRLFDLN